MSNYTLITKKPYACFKAFVINKMVMRIMHLHLGYNDISLLWIIDGKLYDLLFFKVR